LLMTPAVGLFYGGMVRKKNVLAILTQSFIIIAYVKLDRFNAVKKELYNAEIFGMSVTNSKGCGKQKGFIEVFRGMKHEVNLLPKVRIEIAVEEAFVEKVIQAIISGARPGEIGDGKIFVLPVEDRIQIRTGVRGREAI